MEMICRPGDVFFRKLGEKIDATGSVTEGCFKVRIRATALVYLRQRVRETLYDLFIQYCVFLATSDDETGEKSEGTLVLCDVY